MPTPNEEGALGLVGHLHSAGALISVTPLHPYMPKTLEVSCTRTDCDLDMFELHYEYSMPDGTGVEAFSCPYCGESDGLEAIHA